ncbi:MAG: sensor histidine kinase [Spirochaetaceae bacterium]|nr:sensor histidine kinase [Spirochaetaceae bacterium]
MDQRTAELSVANDALHEEIEERVRVEALLRSALKARELLIKEVHHRVKNNLSILNSLIELQKSYAKDCGSLDDLQSRLDAVAIIHEKLYRSADLANIDFAEYLRDLARSLVHTLRDDPASIDIQLDSPAIMMSADTLVSLGLIATEIITNALKHGFVARRGGRISIRAESSAGGLTLTIGDDGVPPASQALLFESNSLGVLLIRELCAQLRGTMEVDIEGGTEYRFRFPDLWLSDHQAAS